MATGKIKTFQPERGFGFIQPDSGGKELFFHMKETHQLGTTPAIGAKVSYDEGVGPKGPKATNVRPLSGGAATPTQAPPTRAAHDPYRFLNPYNFVRFAQAPQTFVQDADTALLGRVAPPPHDRYVGMAGEIICELETVSPLFIADAASEYATAEDEKNEHRTHHFFTYDFGNGPEPAIPAASLRGMVRSVFEAATNSCYAHFDYDRRLSYHLAAEEALKLTPARVEQDAEGRLRLRLLPGTARLAIGKRPDKLYAGRVERYDALVSGRARQAKTKTKVVFKEVKIGNLKHGDACYALAEPLSFPPVWHIHKISTDVNELWKQRRPATESQGQLEVLEGFLCLNHQNIEAKRFERFFFRTFNSKHEAEFVLLPQKVCDDYNLLIADYRERHAQTVEKWKKQDFDPAQVRIETKDGKVKKEAAFSRFILAEDARLKVGDLVYAMLSGNVNAPNVEFIVPVAVPRVLYERKIAELLPQHLWKCHEHARLCPACRTFGWVFGDEEKSPQKVAGDLTTHVAYAGRLRIEHGRLLAPAQTMAPTALAILSSPKPTTTRFYLQPANGKPKDGQGDFAAGYDNADNKLRGRKMYQHHGHEGDLAYWQDKSREFNRVGKNSDQNRTVEGALAPGNKFTFSLRFTNLAAVELGALLWTLELEGSQVHRLGYAKPLGFGSVRIRIKALNLLDPATRYTTLDQNTESIKLNQEQREALRQQFKQAMRRAYGRDFIEQPQIHDLLALLSPPQQALPIHYPRPEVNADPEGKNFEWFMGNNRNKDARFALELAGEEKGFPLIDRSGRVKK